MIRVTACIAAACAAVLLAAPASAAELTKCKLTYDLKTWSVFYKHGEGSGRITCSNGQAADVRIVTRGGGLTFGRQEVIGGKGVFSAVRNIAELYGAYAEAAAHAGAGGAVDARAMMKRNVSLSLAGMGQGINLGFAFGAFDIQPK